MAELTKEEIYRYTGQKLKANFENVPEFNAEVVTAFEYYKTRLLSRTNPDDHDEIENQLFESVKAQIFNGYFMGLEILNEIQIEDEWFGNSEGTIAAQIPDLLRQATDNKIEDIVTIEPMRNLISWLITEYEDIFDFLLNISFNCACLGTKWAFLDEGDKRGIKPFEPNQNGLLAVLDSFTYINPETFLDPLVADKNCEVWNILKSDYRQIDKVGEVTVIKFLHNNATDAYYLNISIRNDYTVSEQQQLMTEIAAQLKLMNEEIERENIILNASSVEDFFLIDNPIQL